MGETILNDPNSTNLLSCHLFFLPFSEKGNDSGGLDRREFLQAYTIMSALIFALLAIELIAFSLLQF
jgi:hypothetical protein